MSLLRILPLLSDKPVERTVTANADVDIECDNGGVRREYRASAPVIDPMKSYETTETQILGTLKGLGYTGGGYETRSDRAGVVHSRKESIRANVTVRIDYLKEIVVEAVTDCT